MKVKFLIVQCYKFVLQSIDGTVGKVVKLSFIFSTKSCHYVVTPIRQVSSGMLNNMTTQGKQQMEVKETTVSSGHDSESKELTGCGGNICCNPFKPCHRFVVLIFVSFISFVGGFCIDNPGALQQMIKLDMNVNTFQFMQLYSWYSWPNVVLSFFEGFLIDRVFGIRLGTNIYAVIFLGGQIVFAVGALINEYWVMIAGRFIFGIGDQSIAIAQNAYLVLWFYGKELNMVFGLQSSLGRVGNALNFKTMQPLYDLIAKTYKSHTALGVTLMIASGMCVIANICALIAGVLDKRAEKILHRKTSQSGDRVRIKDVLNFPISFWLICLISMASYVTLGTFLGLGNEFFTRKFHLTLSDANMAMGLYSILSAIASPILGFCHDRTGKNIIWVFTAILFLFLSHGLSAFTFVSPFAIMTIMGLSYSLLEITLNPMISLVVTQNQLGSAFGIKMCISNLGSAVFSLIAGFVVDNYGYLMFEVLNIACLCIALICVLILWISLDGKGHLDSLEREECSTHL